MHNDIIIEFNAQTKYIFWKHTVSHSIQYFKIKMIPIDGMDFLPLNFEKKKSLVCTKVCTQ